MLSSSDAVRCVIATCTLGIVMQQFLDSGHGLEVMIARSYRSERSSSVGRRMIEHRGPAAKPSTSVLAASVAGAPAALLLMLYGGSRLTSFCRQPREEASPVTKWTVGAEPPLLPVAKVAAMSRNHWRVALSFADWRSLCHAGVACRALCAEARADGPWIQFWEQRFRAPCPVRAGTLEAGPLFLSELLRPRLCAACGERFTLASGADSCRIHPGIPQQVHFYPAIWTQSCCGRSVDSTGCRPIGQHRDSGVGLTVDILYR
jgi:hypothetical protein